MISQQERENFKKSLLELSCYLSEFLHNNRKFSEKIKNYSVLDDDISCLRDRIGFILSNEGKEFNVLYEEEGF